MVFIQQIAESIGAELVLVRAIATSLDVRDPNHPERKRCTSACVAFARKVQGEKRFPSGRVRSLS